MTTYNNPDYYFNVMKPEIEAQQQDQQQQQQPIPSTIKPQAYDEAGRPIFIHAKMKEPYPPGVKIRTHDGQHRENDELTGIISHSSPVYLARNRHRYTVIISPEVWNASGRRETEQPVMLNFYSDEITPIFGRIETIEL